MKTSNRNSYLDLIFESRNKEYGAYHLRRQSTLLLGLSFLLSITLILGGVVLAGRMVRPDQDETSGGTIRMQHPRVVGYSQLSAPPPIETTPLSGEVLPPSQRVKPAQLATKKFLPPVVRPDEEVGQEEIIPTQGELKKVNPGKKTIEGDSLGALDLVDYDEAVIELDIDIELNPLEKEALPPSTTPTSKPKQKEVPKEPPSELQEQKVYTFAEIPAQFPGGEQAMFQFIADHLVYPEIARENNIQGTLLLQMTIEADGSISDIKILRDIGGDCGAAAVRMVKLMPKWKPAIQHNITVRFSIVLPIKFELN